MNLFTYGTLMDPARMAAVCGHPPRGGMPATLAGFVRRDTRFGWPVIFPAPGADARVDGWLWQGLTPADLDALDAYEDREYTRQEVRVQTANGPVTAWVYVGIPEYFRSALL